MSPLRSWVAAATWSVLACTRPVFALPNQFSETGIFEKPASGGWPPVVAGGGPQDGDDFEHPLLITQLPFTETGTTRGFRDDLAAPCTFLGGAPDVVYTYTPPANVAVDLDLCESGFDTALHVYAGLTHDLVHCSDDACGSGARIAGLELQAGVPYFFVVDGWNGGCGTYVLSVVTDPLPCPIEIPAAALPEGEPDCRQDVYDAYNRGCNDYPYAFTRLELGDRELAVVGTYGTFAYYLDEFRDTDWYEVEFDAPAVLECQVTGGAATQLAVLDGREGCEAWSVVCGSILGPACELLSCQVPVESGRYWVFVATRWFSGVRCGTPSLLRLRRDPGRPVGVRPASWTGVKALYR